jgi:hypothetical protein
MDYANQTQWPTSASAAVRRNIYINTVQCGVDEATTRVWRDIAHAAEGRYAAIPQDGGVRVAVATPFDDELGRLGHELDATNLTYGRRAEREAKEESRSRAASYAASGPAPAAADRAVAKAALSSGMKDSEDLVSLASSTGSASAALARVASDELPDQLRGKSKAEQQQILEDGRQKRAAIQKKIADASQKRAAWLAEQAKKAPKSATDSFDTEVGTMIRAEGAAAGLTW